MIENFLSQNKEELLKWINTSYKLNVSGGFNKSVSKLMLENDILFWIEENNVSIEVEKEIFNYLDSL